MTLHLVLIHQYPHSDLALILALLDARGWTGWLLEIAPGLNYSVSARCRWRGISTATELVSKSFSLSRWCKERGPDCLQTTLKGVNGMAENLQLPKSQQFAWKPSHCQNILFTQFCSAGSSTDPLCITILKVNRKWAIYVSHSSSAGWLTLQYKHMLKSFAE